MSCCKRYGVEPPSGFKAGGMFKKLRLVINLRLVIKD